MISNDSKSACDCNACTASLVATVLRRNTAMCDGDGAEYYSTKTVELTGICATTSSQKLELATTVMRCL
jgi:hypothetical protein